MVSSLENGGSENRNDPVLLKNYNRSGSLKPHDNGSERIRDFGIKIIYYSSISMPVYQAVLDVSFIFSIYQVSCLLVKC
jgi:hypothetical protein